MGDIHNGALGRDATMSRPWIQGGRVADASLPVPWAFLDESKRRHQVRRMKTMMLLLLGVRLLFLSAAGAMCLYGLLHAADPKVAWYWTVGHAVVLAACVFLIGRVWASLKATWKE